MLFFCFFYNVLIKTLTQKYCACFKHLRLLKPFLQLFFFSVLGVEEDGESSYRTLFTIFRILELCGEYTVTKVKLVRYIVAVNF